MTTLAKAARLPDFKCLACGVVMDAASGVVDKQTRKQTPKPGDFSICIACGHLTVFNDDMTLRPLTAAERREVAHDQKVALAVAAVRVLPKRK